MSHGGVFLGNHPISKREATVDGRLVERGAETFYRIEHAEALPHFLTTVVSDSDHWLFVGSNGALTAGRPNSQIVRFPPTTQEKRPDGAGVVGAPPSAFAAQGG